MSVNADHYFEAVTADLTAIDDPVERARVASAEISAVAAVLEKLGQARIVAVREARTTMSAQAVATAMGITRARVYQLLD